MGTAGAIILVGYVVYLVVSILCVLRRGVSKKRTLFATIVVASVCFFVSVVLVNEYRGFVDFPPVHQTVLKGITAILGWFGLLTPGVVIGIVLLRRPDHGPSKNT